MSPPSPLPSRKRIRLPGPAYRSGEPFLLTLCAPKNTAPFHDERLAQIVIDHLDEEFSSIGGPVLAYALLPDHLHVVAFGCDDVVQWVCRFKATTTGRARRAGFALPPWQRSFHDRCLPRTGDGIDRAVAYVLDNPVRLGLVRHAQEWPYVRAAMVPIRWDARV